MTGQKKKQRRRPCSVCRQWFTPQPRVRHCQRTCGKPACQAEQRARTQRSYRKRNPQYWTERRLQKQLESAADQGAAPPPSRHAPAVFQRIPWELVQDEIGSQAVVLIAFFVRLAVSVPQAAIVAQVINIIAKSDRHQRETRQDATDYPSSDRHNLP